MNKESKKNNLIKNKVKDWLIQIGETTKERLKRTTGEVLIFALLGAWGGTYFAHQHEMKREKIPLGFSEIEVVERKAEQESRKLWPINLHQMKTNDLCMKIFEAYNQSLETKTFGNPSEVFASRLYDAIDYRNIYKYNLKDLLNQVPSYHPSILKELQDYLISRKNIAASNKIFEKAWDEKHRDNYHTELRTRVVPSWKGTVRVEVYPVQIYDNTDHYFTYHKAEWEKGAELLNKQFTNLPVLKVQETIYKTDETNAEWEYATRKSRESEWEFKIMSQEELLKAANSRYTGSTLLEDINTIKILYPKLKEANNKRNQAKKTAKSTHYRTDSHSHSWPKEFQIAEKVLEVGQELEVALTELENVIRETDTQVPLLKTKIKEFIEKGYLKRFDYSNKEKKQLSKEVLKLTKEIYKLNFKNGLEVERYRWRVLVLAFILWWVLGGGIGMGIDYITNELNFYDRIKI